ncbi:WAS/WASL-interacting protein family member 2-like isoform X1 [Entelurus aequoreus]|uniref:WAS/WASL-interacting protein family member 2-like isoform X1 n=2 Tax=Entelurus aequoreus TaxID=161455 RepID=UPI002B1E4A84|nr:WAS/WASL-interacting protein family member 2-like isoform X1 [Entelurus aequoreus]
MNEVVCDSIRMPLPPAPPTGGPPPPPSSCQVKGRGVLLSDVCKGAGLRQVAQVSDRSGPQVDAQCSPGHTGDHPYIRLYQYLHQQGAPPDHGEGGARSPSARAPAPLPPAHHHDDAPSPSPEQRRAPSSPPHTAAGSSHAPSSRRGNAPSPPSSFADKPLPLTSPANSRRPPTTGGNPPAVCASLALPPPTYHLADVSFVNKRTAPLPGGHASTRGPAPPPPPPSPSQSHRPTPSPGRGTASREAPPPPPCRAPGSPSLSSDPPARGKPPPPPSRTPAAPPPPPPSLCQGHASSPSSLAEDFESKYLFHSLDDFPPPDEYRHFAKIYPSKAYRAMRGAPPLPPVGR